MILGEGKAKKLQRCFAKMNLANERFEEQFRKEFGSMDKFDQIPIANYGEDTLHTYQSWQIAVGVAHGLLNSHIEELNLNG